MRALIRRVAVISMLICIVTAGMALLYDPWAATAVGVVWTAAVIVFAFRFQFVEDVEPVESPTPPLPNRVDADVILAAIDGAPADRPMSFREQYQIAVICDWRGDDVGQIAATIGRSSADAETFLAIAQSALAVSR